MKSVHLVAFSLLGASLVACAPPVDTASASSALLPPRPDGLPSDGDGPGDAIARPDVPPDPEVSVFQFDVPGATGPVRAEVRRDAPGLVHITALPSRLVASPHLGARALPFPATFTKKFCDDIARAAKNARNPLFPPAARKLERERVRSLTAQDLFLPFASALASKDFEAAALAAAHAAGIDAFALARPLPLFVATSVEITFSKMAISRTLADLDEVRSDFTAGLEGARSAALTGKLWVSTSAADVLCDLWSHAAEVTVGFSLGREDGPPSKTTLSGLDPSTF
jgi:hypothetical protein